MSLIPDWAPNIHPLIVHFPIVLLITAAAVDLCSLLLRNKAARDAATWFYVAGAAAAIVTYFTGRSAADGLLLPAQVNPLVNAHSDWALRTTWFFIVLAPVRVAVSYALPPKLPVLVGVFVVTLGGLGLLFETAERGGELVYAHGLGVRGITTDKVPEGILAAAEAPIDPGIIDLENGSWVWRPVQGADAVLAEQFDWLEGAASHLAPDMVTDEDEGLVLGLHPHDVPVLFVGGGPLDGVQAEVQVDLDAFDGTLMLVHHVQDATTFDFLSVDDTAVKLGRMENGAPTVFEEKPLTDNGWLTLRVFGGDGHFRGYVNGELLTHGHADDLGPGRFGLRVDGTGTVLIERMQVQTAG